MDRADTARAELLARTRRSQKVLRRASAALQPSGLPPGTLARTLPSIVLESAAGSRLRDVDGNEYVDVTMGFGVHFFGHAPPFLRRISGRGLEAGSGVGVITKPCFEAADALSSDAGLPCIHFGTTGTEVVMTAVRMARARTRRPLLVRFNGHYHGHSDAVLAGEPLARPDAPVPPDALCVVLPFGERRALEVVERLAPRTAAVLASPVASPNPALFPTEFLRELRRITRAAGSALILDEVLTGYRFAPRPLCVVAGIEPDILALGKLLGGGHPVGVLASTPDWMGEMTRVQGAALVFPHIFMGGTFNRSGLTMAACAAVLAKISRAGEGLYRALERRTAPFVRELDAILRASACGSVSARASLVALRFESPAFAETVALELLLRGVHIRSTAGPFMTFFLSTAHTPRDLRAVTNALRAAVDVAAGGPRHDPRTGALP